MKNLILSLINRNRVLRKYESPGVKGIGLQLYLTDHCNYGCRGCLAFSPLAKEFYADLVVVENDLKRMAELTGAKVDVINLLGGEPLLHPHLTSFFDIARKHFSATEIRLVTNGILLPRQGKAFWLAMKKNRMVLRPTKTPLLQLKWREIEKKARYYKVPFEYYGIDYTQEGREVPKGLEHFVLDLSGKQSNTISTCPHSAHHLYSLIDGKIFPCAVSANIRHFNAYFNKNLELQEGDYIDIYQVKSIDELLSYWKDAIPFCRYCNLDKVTWIPFALTDKDIGEWI
jgi:MoaA/NifB/PqqE/SkfB family radical SAM enzyme